MRAAVLLAATIALPPGLRAQTELSVPDDWVWRLDGDQQMVRGEEVPAGAWRFVRMPPGWHLTTTDLGVQLFPRERTVRDRWGISFEGFLFPNPSDAEFGLVVEDATVEPAGSRQLQFWFRRDGRAALMLHRAGRDSLAVPWKADSAVSAHDGKSVVKYTLELRHEGGWFSFSVNGQDMIAVPGFPMSEFRPGLRIGPGLNLHVTRFDLLTPLAPPRPRRED